MLETRGNNLTWLGHATFRITTPSGKVDRSRSLGANQPHVSQATEEIQPH